MNSENSSSLKPIAWLEVKTRYLNGEKPSSIAKDYRDLTAEKISDKVKRQGWLKEKKALLKKSSILVFEGLEKLKYLSLEIAIKLLENLLEDPEAHQALLDKAIAINPLTRIALSEAFKFTDSKQSLIDSPKGPIFISLPGIDVEKI